MNNKNNVIKYFNLLYNFEQICSGKFYRNKISLKFISELVKSQKITLKIVKHTSKRNVFKCK